MSEPPTLGAIVTAPGYADRVSAAVERIANAPDPATAQHLLVEAIGVLGAQSAFFASFVRDGNAVANCRFMLACEPVWDHQSADGMLHDPWLAYAAHRTEPAIASALPAVHPADPELREGTHRQGFASALLVPAHSGPGQGRISLLALGSPQAGFFESEGLARFRIGARALAAELHDWWLGRLRREFIARARITPLELELLRHERCGHGSKRIASALNVSPTAVDSRFQRMNARLGVPNRRVAARLAVECGLLAG